MEIPTSLNQTSEERNLFTDKQILICKSCGNVGAINEKVHQNYTPVPRKTVKLRAVNISGDRKRVPDYRALAKASCRLERIWKL